MPLPLIPIAISLASQFAPMVMKYFTNSDTAATVAGQVVNIAKTLTGESTPEAAEQVLREDPKLAMEFQLALIANETTLQQMYLGDIQSARARDIELAKAGIHNNRANVLAASALILVIVCLFIVVWSVDADDFAKATISLILGRALGWVDQLFSFDFGTTRASKTKDDTISKLSGG